MALRLLALAVLLFVSGCGAAPVDTEPQYAEPIAMDAELQVSDAFLPAERAEVDAAIGEWYRATGGSVRFALVRSPGQGPWALERGPVQVGLGTCNRLARRITLDADAIYPVGDPSFDLEAWGEFRAVTLHELGHAMGLEHGDGELMDQHVGSCVDRRSLAKLCDLRPCAAFVPTCE